MADFPAGVYSPRTKANRSGVVYDALQTKRIYAEDIQKLDAEVVAVETILGTLPSGTYDTVREWLEALDARGGGGSVWYTGAGAPSNAVGNDGDLYLNTTNGDVYQKSAGTWGASVGNIKGPIGDTGAQGATGAQGDTGAQGATGAAGADGAFPLLTTKSLAVATASLTTDAFTGKKFLRLLVYIPVLSTTDQLRMRFNSDSGANYAGWCSENFTEAYNSAQSGIKLDQNNRTTSRYVVLDIYNIAGISKRAIGWSMIANSLLSSINISYIWNNTANAITTITLYLNNGNNLPIGTEITVLGNN